MKITRYIHSSQYDSKVYTDKGYEITYKERSYGTHAINVIFYSKNGEVLYNDSNYVGTCYLGDVEFMFRVNNTINVIGEKTTEVMLKRAVEATVEELDLTLRDYEIFPDFSAIPGQYLVMIETDDEKRFSISREELSKVFLEKLCIINTEFTWKYEIDYIQAPDVYFEKPGAQMLFKEKMDAENRGGSQFKPVHIIRTSEQKEFFLNLREF